MKKRLIDIADVIRSKNSGPFEITFDVILKEQAVYERLRELKIPSKAEFAKLYNIDEATVFDVIWFDPAKAIKITILRPVASGAVSDTDIYGAQQHAPLMNMELDF